MSFDRCPCDRCNGRETGAWEDERSEWPSSVDIKAAWADYWAELKAEMDAEIASLEAAGICIGCGGTRDHEPAACPANIR